MGLDSVELVVEWENHFDIQIPDLVAEKISTVQDSVDAVASILNISNENSSLKERIFAKLKQVIAKTNQGILPIDQYDLVAGILPNNNKQTWESLSKELGLTIPYPKNKTNNSFTKEIYKAFNWHTNFEYKNLSFSQLTDAICIENYKTLVNPKSINSKYEIYISIVALTAEKMGIDVYEFSPEKTFHKGFEID